MRSLDAWAWAVITRHALRHGRCCFYFDAAAIHLLNLPSY